MSSIYSSIVNHSMESKIFQDFAELDNFLAQFFEYQDNYNYWNKNALKKFAIYWSCSALLNGYFLYSTYLSALGYFSHACLVNLLNHVIQIEAFYIFMLAQAIQNRLDLISQFERLESDKSIEDKREMVMRITDIVNQISSCFKLPLLLNMIQINFALLINTYWLWMAFLGVPMALINGNHVFVIIFNLMSILFSESLSFILPSIAIVFFLGQITRTTEKYFLKIISTLTTTKEKYYQTEDMLIFLYGSSFTINAFEAFNLSFKCLGAVRTTLV